MGGTTDHNKDDPTQSSWTGQFKQPFPKERPGYYTDANGPVEWDYHNPCNTWEDHRLMFDHAQSTLEKERPGMYKTLLEKLNRIYGEKEH